MHTISFILYATTDSKWCEHNTLAHTYIVINIVDITVSGLHIQELAVDVWCFLCNQFKLQDPIVIQDMCLHLAFLWYEDEMAVANYFKRLHLLQETINYMGTAITKSKFCQIVLMKIQVNGILGMVVITLLTCQDSIVAKLVLSLQ